MSALGDEIFVCRVDLSCIYTALILITDCCTTLKASVSSLYFSLIWDAHAVTLLHGSNDAPISLASTPQTRSFCLIQTRSRNTVFDGAFSSVDRFMNRVRIRLKIERQMSNSDCDVVRLQINSVVVIDLKLQRRMRRDGERDREGRRAGWRLDNGKDSVETMLLSASLYSICILTSNKIKARSQHYKYSLAIVTLCIRCSVWGILLAQGIYCI